MTILTRASFFWVLATCATAAQPLVEQSDLYVSGTEGYHTFRIPSLVVSTRSTVLAFCEGRKESRSDTGNIHLMLKHSTDGGRTWGPLQSELKSGRSRTQGGAPRLRRRADPGYYGVKRFQRTQAILHIG